ncbi:MAG: hypothetical protein LW832_02780 [Parachlamydia sp.]|jgi:hypothetical protein|nr:hypothetical protein [Parachlamydia sp.]
MSEQEIEQYGDDLEIASLDAKVPKFLIATYIILPIAGLIGLYVFWNGSVGWFDRGAWKELQIAANTTFPVINQNDPPETVGKEKKTIRSSRYAEQ